MIFNLILFSIITVFASSQRRYLSLVGFLLLVSLGPLLKFSLGLQSTGVLYTYYFGVFFIALILREHGRLSLFGICLVLAFLVVIFFQTLTNNLNFNALSLGVSRFLFLPILACYAAKDIIKKDRDIFSVFVVYLLINFLIFYVRAFYSYNFFNVMDVALEEWTYRPSNLSNPIIFAIEVAVLLSLMISSNISNRYKIIISIISVIPLALMFSRSSYVIILANYAFFLVYSRKFVALFWSGVISVLLGATVFYITGELPYIVSIFDYNAGAYGTRMSSMSESLNFIAEMDLISLLIGLGSGSASQHGAGHGMEMVYVENAFISLVIENGILILIGFFLSLMYFYFRTGLKRNSAYFFVILLSIGLVNLFSASLTVLSVQLLYWTIYFYGLTQNSPVNYPLNRNGSYAS